MSNIAIITCFNKRPEISRLFLMGVDRLRIKTARHHKIQVYAAIEDYEGNKELCDEYGVSHVVMNTNGALGAKWNRALFIALDDKSFQWDRCMIMGDDDLISTEGFRKLVGKITDGDDYVGFPDVYFYDSVSGEALYFKYSAPNKLIGCGRMISRTAIEETCFEIPVRLKQNINVDHYKHRAGETIYTKLYFANHLIQLDYAEPVQQRGKFALWHDLLMSGLDNHSDLLLAMNHVYPRGIHTNKCHLLDVKSADNIWKFNTRRANNVAEMDDPEDALWFLGKDELSYLKDLTLNTVAL